MDVSFRSIFAELHPFVPRSKGSMEDRARSAIDAANRIFPAICDLYAVCGIPRHRIMTLDEWCSFWNRDCPTNEVALSESFTKYGSDKATSHDYHRIYGRLLPDAKAPYKIFEIGLGSTNPEILSNMGPNGQPGASLHAFAECYPEAMVYGADIDRDILFQEDRIRTYWIDQTNPESFTFISDYIPGDLDLAIDDGLHCPHANISSLGFMLPKLKIGGHAVIEDIGDNALPIWHAVAVGLSRKYVCNIVKAKDGNLFIVQKAGA